MVDVARVHIELAGGGAEDHRLLVLEEVVNEPINVRQLTAFAVHLEVVGIALKHHPWAVAGGVAGKPPMQARKLDVVPRIAALPEQLDPVGDPDFGDQFVDVGVVVGMELLEVMPGHEVKALVVRREPLKEKTIRPLEDEPHLVVVDLFHDYRLAARGEIFGRSGSQVGVPEDRVVPEHDVVGGELHPIGPFQPAPEREGVRHTVVDDIEGLRDVRDDLLPVRVPVHDAVVADGPTEPGRVGDTEQRGLPSTAVISDAFGRLDHERLCR